ncbi:MAG: hypothetical protein Q7T07_11290 [Burkholderiaceae bacterium]|nr:hypothetical protein [Burkholderiaceae bacterium]
MPQVVSLWTAAGGVAAAGVAAAGVSAVGVAVDAGVLVSLLEPPPQADNSKDADNPTYKKTDTFLRNMKNSFKKLASTAQNYTHLVAETTKVTSYSAVASDCVVLYHLVQIDTQATTR